MKNSILILLFVVTAASAQIQQDLRKHIIVTGSAEMSVQPDMVEFDMFVNSGKKGQKSGFEEIKKELRRLLVKHKIDPSTMVMETSERWNWWNWWYGSRYSQRSMRFKVDGKTDLSEFLKEVDDDWYVELRIVKATSSETQKLRKQVKKEAVRAAREKAQYLLEDLGEELDGVLSVEEVPETENYYYSFNQNSIASNSNLGRVTSDNRVTGISDIKLRYEVRVKFAIK